MGELLCEFDSEVEISIAKLDDDVNVIATKIGKTWHLDVPRNDRNAT